MNVLSISPTCVVAEEQEVDLHALLQAEGFEVIKVPFRAVYDSEYEFGLSWRRPALRYVGHVARGRRR